MTQVISKEQHEKIRKWYEDRDGSSDSDVRIHNIKNPIMTGVKHGNIIARITARLRKIIAIALG